MRCVNRAWTAVLMLTVGAVLTGCATTVPGNPQADRAKEQGAQSAAYERGMAAFEKHFGTMGDEHAKVYNYVSYGDFERRNEFESFKHGSEPTLLLKKRNGEPDLDSDVLTPAKSDVDYIKLGKARGMLAPTPWVALPTQYKAGPDCVLLTWWAACKLFKGLAQTKLEAPDRQEQQVVKRDGGYELRSGILLGELIKQGMTMQGDDAAEREVKADADMKASMIPVTMRFTSDWAFTGFELRTKIDGKTKPLELQIGYEVVGKAKTKDFPPTPKPAEVTVITEKAAVDAFWAAFYKVG